VKLFVATIVLDGMPWLACIYAELMRLTDIPWQWTIVEGAAMNVRDTSWCAKQAPRLSTDGTGAFLDAISHNPRIKLVRRLKWEGKAEMCNAALATFTESGVLLQQDSDELWTCDQYRTIVHLFEDDSTLGSACFKCRYFVGPNIVTTDEGDWWRAWRFYPGDTFRTHEPPVMTVGRGRSEGREWTKRIGLVFDHYSYALPGQVAFKEKFYGPRYKGAVAGWHKLQAHPQFPTAIKPFFPWSAPSTMVDRVFSDAPVKT
jgi:hypothetical protein